MKKLILSIVLLFVGIGLSAQSVEISGQIRPRAEYKHGYRAFLNDGQNPAYTLSQRSRINLLYTSKKIKTAISFQDVRIWGDVTTANRKDANGTMLFQAWGEYYFSDKFSAKLGRQPLSYDDQRLMSGADYVQQARSHDLLLLKFAPSKATQLHAGLAFNQTADKDTGTYYNLNYYKAMQYVWFHHDVKNLGISFIFINHGLAYSKLVNNVYEQKIAYSQTFGPYLSYKKNALKMSAAAYLQTGKNGKNIDKTAQYAAFDVNYDLSKEWTAGLAFMYLSGNDQLNPDNKDHEFVTLYGAGHKFNGYMDYFYAGISHKGAGLLDYYLPVSYKKGKLFAEGQLHVYQSPVDIKDPLPAATTAMKPYLGTEYGLQLTYAVSPEFSVSGSYAQLFGTETLQALKGGNNKRTANWAMLTLSFNPVFFKSEK